MADILKITTPLINKSQPMDPKRPVDVNTQFDIHNVNRVVKPATQEEILAQNNGLNQQEGTSEMLLSLLKDPSVAASSLKNLYLMQELIKLLPVNNETFTKEIQQLFDQMFVSQEEIAPEMLRQEQITTVFTSGLGQSAVIIMVPAARCSNRWQTAWNSSRKAWRAAIRSPSG